MNEFGLYIRKGWPLAIIVILAASAFYINHAVTSDYNSRIADAEQELSSMKTAIELSGKRTEDYNRIKDDLKEFRDFMYTKDEPQRLIDRLKADAADYNVNLGDIQIDVPKFFKDRGNPRYTIPVNFNLSLKGGYYELVDFLRTFEKRPYLDKIDETNIALNSPDGRLLKMTIKGTLRVFDGNIVEWCGEDGT